jgi:uncharacterized protein (TIGR02271 family)
MQTRTLSTLVAVFRTDAEARSAADDLRANGFDTHDIFITAENDAAVTDAGAGAHEYRHHEGGIKGWFHSVFGENHDQVEETHNYEDAIHTGNVLLSLETNEDNIDLAADILNRHAPVNVHRDVEQGRTSTAKETGQGAIPVVREELQVGKRAILRGGVRVYSRLSERPVEETIALREEHVRVDRTPVNRAVTDADLRRGEQQVLEVKEYTEEPVVSKTARVVEEVRVRKEASERNQTIRDTVRQTDVQVENINDKADYTNDKADYTEDFRSDYAQRYAASGETYETYAPAYNYGYSMAGDPRYSGRTFDEVEPDLRADYGQRYPNSTWERMKDSVRYGWERLTHRHHD